MNIESETLFRSTLPRMIGKVAVDHFRENFMRSGFVNNGLEKWKLPARYNAKGKRAAQKYPPLLSSRKELYNSIYYKTKPGMVIIASDKEYAQAHNEGFTGTVTVKKHERNVSRKVMVYSLNTHKGKKTKTTTGEATVKEHSRNMNIPKRQFIGDSAELDTKIEKIINNELSKLFSM